jgi:cytochrome c peroxidase
MVQVVDADSDDDLRKGGCVIDLGFAGRGAADPSALACDRSGLVAVALGGVDEVALGRSPTGYLRRYSVGRRPTALAVADGGKTVFVADTLEDTISVVDAATGVRTKVIALGPKASPSLVECGERLFFDARLSHDGWMSCHSCHTDGHTSGLLADTLGDGAYGAPKRVPSLLGTARTGPWSWAGHVERLDEQVRKSIVTTMRNPNPSADDVSALTAYLQSLVPPRAVAVADRAAVERGRKVFRSEGCAECHSPPLYTSRGTYDVGLADEANLAKFNPPSLLGVDRREPLLHDGRASRLADVFLRHGHPTGSALPADEVADLVAFLRSL